VREACGLVLLGGVFLLSLEWWSAWAYLSGLYGSLGRGPWPAALALWALLLGIALPLAVWAALPLLVGWSLRDWRVQAGVGLLCGALLASAATSHYMATATPTGLRSADAGGEADLARALPAALAGLSTRLPAGPAPAPSLLRVEPVACPEAPEAAPLTLVATFVGSAGTPISVCLQGQSLDPVLAALRQALLERALRGPLELEVVTGWQHLSRRHGWLDALKLRPGLDGICHGSACVMPWQLLAQGSFSTHRPLNFIPDFQFGAAPEQLRQAVLAGPGSNLGGLTRVTTDSYVLDLAAAEPELTSLVRMRRRQVPLTSQALERAERAAQGYVLKAQLPDGRFRYTLDPITGAADAQSVNLARQAGTTLVLCELGEPSAAVEQAIRNSLAAFRPFRRRSGDVLGMTLEHDAALARLGDTALPLLSLLACRARVRSELEKSIGGMARFILKLQRPDGGFSPALNLATGLVESGPEPLYASGQAVMALVLLEQMQQTQQARQARPRLALPAPDVVHAAVERAMNYFATRYWSHPLADFFFLEENWHCLAARAALGVHPHRGYEDFCWNYVRFKSRLILEREQGADPDFDGGFGFGNIVPPHNTGAAGFGEALAAALAVRRAQGNADAAEERLLGRVLGFLLRQQWSPENCFACASPEVIGGMSEHTHSFVTRIDFTQHEWAALGHGARALGLSTTQR
jgi:hypothetical protein